MNTTAATLGFLVDRRLNLPVGIRIPNRSDNTGWGSGTSMGSSPMISISPSGSGDCWASSYTGVAILGLG